MSSRKYHHLGWISVTLTMAAYYPIRISANAESPHPTVDHTMVGVILANHQIGISVIGAIIIYMMDNRLMRKRFTQGLLGHQNVL